MISNIVLGIIVAVMLVFSVGAAYLATEEKKYRYDINVTDERDIL
jgi:septal ring-binding cell division protein DamX